MDRGVNRSVICLPPHFAIGCNENLSGLNVVKGIGVGSVDELKVNLRRGVEGKGR
jgi:hypothetical protein